MKWYQQRSDAKRAARVAQGLAAFDAVEPDILKEIRDREKEALEAAGAADSEDSGDRDTLFREAAEVVVQTQQGSTSLLQRRLKVGYGRAARIIDQLELAGVLGPSDGPRGREVLVGLDELDRICGPRA
jgi:S-DNA-T family DNA segregation ATPase FtsK/SpoIIIE